MQQASQEPSREAVIAAARAIMAAAKNCALVTLDGSGAPQARMMDPFPPEEDLSVWMATSPDTRKALEIEADARVALVYFDPGDPGYATLIGTARLVDDLAERRARWKDEWEPYYPGGPEGDSYRLIEVVARRLEVVSLAHDIAADPLAWEPAIVELSGSPMPS
jgi:general stress protein 26